MEELARLLRHRLAVISDHAFRDRDPDGHLAALQHVSESIANHHVTLRDSGQLTPHLEHFLANCSYDKALDLIEKKSR